MIEQLSIFAQNTKGSMVGLTKLVSDAGIDIYNVVTNDSAEFGIVRMLVTEPQKACDILTEHGYMCKLNKVIGVKISDEVGSLTNLLQAITDSNINIDYLYVSYSRDSKTPLAVIHAPSYAEVEVCLKARGYEIVE